MTPSPSTLYAWRFAVALISGSMAAVIVAAHVAGDGDRTDSPKVQVAIPADSDLDVTATP